VQEGVPDTQGTGVYFFVAKISPNHTIFEEKTTRKGAPSADSFFPCAPANLRFDAPLRLKIL
jgi:hypothetical protein